MASTHINGNLGDFAKVVLMPGDPKRAEFIAKTFLTDVVCVTDVRGMLGFTGKTKNGKRISVMASGMGQPSIGIYTRELFTHFGVETIIRVGTCGSYQDYINLSDIIIAMGSSTDSNWMGQYQLLGASYCPTASYNVLREAVDVCNKKQCRYHVGNVLSADVFYDHDKDYWRKWQGLGVLAVEMEAYALYQIAAEMRKNALCILTVSDSFTTTEKLSSEQRQVGLVQMIEIGIETAEKFAD